VQSYCAKHAHAVELPGQRPKIVAGIVALMRVLFENARSADAGSRRLWCDLSQRDLATLLIVDRKKLRVWLEVGDQIGAIVPDHLPGHSQAFRYRPNWEWWTTQLAAAARAGKIPQMPFFEEVRDTGPVPETGGGFPPVVLEPGERSPGSESAYSFFS
jgi:hypothetical protein